MKFWIFLFLTIFTSVFAQFDLLISRLAETRQMYNPANAGFNNTLDIYVFNRNTWSPSIWKHQSQVLGVEKALSQERIGLGGFFVNSQNGLEQKTGALLNSNYKINLFTGFLCMGLGVGVFQNSLNLKNMNIKDLSDEYANSPLNHTYVDINFGLDYKKKSWNLGVFLKHLNKPKYDYWRYLNEPSQDILMGLNLDKKWKLSQSIDLYSNLHTEYRIKKAFRSVFLTHFIIKDKFSFGIGYRTNKILLSSISLDLSEINSVLHGIKLVYSYERYFGSLSNLLSQNHEIGIVANISNSENVKKIKNKKKEVSPLDF
ncbi:MAG: PorP/SprF family type IX secretion system membrane protein [Cytophagales bacterium]